jgi:hypothetical protein
MCSRAVRAAAVAVPERGRPAAAAGTAGASTVRAWMGAEGQGAGWGRRSIPRAAIFNEHSAVAGRGNPAKNKAKGNGHVCGVVGVRAWPRSFHALIDRRRRRPVSVSPALVGSTKEAGGKEWLLSLLQRSRHDGKVVLQIFIFHILSPFLDILR